MVSRMPFSLLIEGVKGDFIHSGPDNTQRDTSATISELCARRGNGFRFRYSALPGVWVWRYPLDGGLSFWEANTSKDGVGQQSCIVTCDHKITEGYVAIVSWMAMCLKIHAGAIAFGSVLDIKVESTDKLEVVKDAIDESGMVSFDEETAKTPEELRLTTGKIVTGSAGNLTFNECDSWLAKFQPNLSLIGSRDNPEIITDDEVDKILNYQIRRAPPVDSSSSSGILKQPLEEDESTQEAVASQEEEDFTFPLEEDVPTEPACFQEEDFSLPQEEEEVLQEVFVPPQEVPKKKKKKTGRLPSFELRSLAIENSKFKPVSEGGRRRRQKRIIYS